MNFALIINKMASEDYSHPSNKRGVTLIDLEKKIQPSRLLERFLRVLAQRISGYIFLKCKKERKMGVNYEKITQCENCI